MKSQASPFYEQELHSFSTQEMEYSANSMTLNNLRIINDVNFSNSLPFVSDRKEIVFIEGNIPDHETLMQSLAEGREVYLLDPAQDGLAQIVSLLQGREGIDALHILSLGSQSNINLGQYSLNLTNLPEHQAQLQAIGKTLSANADILLYGCNIAQNNDHRLIDSLALITGADIAASNDLTGNAEKLGDWDLEVRQGDIETKVVLDAATAKLFSSVLDIASATVNFTDSSGNFISGGHKTNASEM